MLRKIKFNNFYSFKEEQEISFLASKKDTKDTYDYFKSKSNQYITKMAGFLGSNASGKTNVMRVFGFLKYFVCVSERPELTGRFDKPYKTFFNNDLVSNFHVEFEKDNHVYFYEFSIKENIVLEEKLVIKELAKSAREKKIFLRKLNDIEYFNKEFLGEFPLKFLEKVRSDISIVSFIKAHYNVDIINKVYYFFDNFKTNIDEMGQINNIYHQTGVMQLYIDNPDLKKKMDDIVCNFEMGLKGFKFETNNKNNEQNLLTVTGIHNTDEKNNELSFPYESRGTQALFFTLANILSAIKNNGVAIIDEIETGFHPEALNKLIGYFIDEAENKEVQIIFSSHSLGFMNKSDMHQIYLVEKDSKSNSFVYRLNEVEGVRSDDNFFAKYMAGAYGAFPKIRA